MQLGASVGQTDCTLQSRWTLRKQYQRRARDLCAQHIIYLQSILDKHGIAYDKFKTVLIPSINVSHAASVNVLNLEQYSEHVQELGGSIQAEPIGLTEVISRVDSALSELTGESADSVVHQYIGGMDVVDVPTALREKRNGLQCQICCKVFDSRNKLFEHIKGAHSEVSLERKAEPTKAQRHRYNPRKKYRKGASASSKIPDDDLRSIRRSRSKGSDCSGRLSASIANDTTERGGESSVTGELCVTVQGGLTAWHTLVMQRCGLLSGTYRDANSHHTSKKWCADIFCHGSSVVIRSGPNRATGKLRQNPNLVTGNIVIISEVDNRDEGSKQLAIGTGTVGANGRLTWTNGETWILYRVRDTRK